MLDDKEKRKLLKTFVMARDRWGLRILEGRYEQMNQAGPTQSRQIATEQWLNLCFITKYTWIPGFHNHVEKEMDKPHYRKRINFFIGSILKSLVSDGWFDVTDMLKKPKPRKNEDEEQTTDSITSYERRSIQNIVKREYPEVMFPVDKSDINGLDLRKTPYSSVFTSSPMPTSEQRFQALASHLHEKQTRPAVQEVRDIASLYSVVNVSHLQRLFTFRKRVLSVLGKLDLTSGKPGDRRDFLIEQFERVGPILFEFYHDIHSIVAMGWWNKRPRDKKRELMEKAFPFKLSRKEVDEAIKMLGEFGLRDDHIAYLLYTTSQVIIKTGNIEHEMLIAEATYDLNALTSEFQGVMANNIGKRYEEQGHDKKAIKWINRAIEHYAKSKSTYREIVALKIRAEIRINAGNKELGEKDIEKVLTRIKYLKDRREIFGAYWNLANCYRRLGNAKEEYKYLIKCQEFEDVVKEIDLVIAFHNRLSHFNH